MNKLQEVLDKLCELGRKELTFREICEMEIANKILQELVEKATPKKPIYSDFEEVDDNIYIPNTAKCPTCGNEFEFGEFNDIDSHHCVCGQALDWSEEE